MHQGIKFSISERIFERYALESKRVTNTWGKCNFIEALLFLDILKQKIYNNKLTRKIRLFILHSFVVVCTNYCSHFVETCKVKFFLPEISAVKILLSISVSIPLFNQQGFVSKQKRQQNVKKYPDSFSKQQSLRVSFDFSTNWCN